MGKSRPTDNDAPMKALPPVDRACVRKAALILRLASALNLGRSGAVQAARVRMRNGGLSLRLVSKKRGNVDLELWAVEKEKSYFREVFGRELSALPA
jgi:exopolyphosphatase/guanosine-5'-triphosphate,3'-diphosphate pyrophosphatase